MDEIAKLEQEREEYLRKLEVSSRTSNDERQRKVASEILDVMSGRIAVHSLYEKEEQARQAMLERWERLKSKEDFESAGFVLCKKCGYKRWLHKDYGNSVYRCPACRGEYAEIYDDDHYLPNKISLKDRAWYIGASCALIIYIGYCLYSGMVYLPSRGHTLVFHEWAMVSASIAIGMLVIYLMSYVIDHYDKRNNEYKYPWLRGWSVFGFFVFFILSIVTEFHQL